MAIRQYLSIKYMRIQYPSKFMRVKILCMKMIALLEYLSRSQNFSAIIFHLTDFFTIEINHIFMIY